MVCCGVLASASEAKPADDERPARWRKLYLDGSLTELRAALESDLRRPDFHPVSVEVWLALQPELVPTPELPAELKPALERPLKLHSLRAARNWPAALAVGRAGPVSSPQEALLLAHAAERMAAWDEALAWSIRALELDPGDLLAARSISGLLWVEPVREHVVKALAARPAWARYAADYLRHGRDANLRGARPDWLELEAVDRWRKRAPPHDRVMLARAVTLRDLGRCEEALPELAASRAARPWVEARWRPEAQCLGWTRGSDAALNFARAQYAKVHGERRAAAWVDLIETDLSSEGEPLAARAARWPEDAPYSARVEVAAELLGSQPAAALTQLERLRRIAPDSPELAAWVVRAHAAEPPGDEAVRQLIARSGAGPLGSPDFVTGVPWELFSHEQLQPHRRAVVERATAEFPLQPELWFLLGYVHMTEDRRDDAFAAFRRAFELTAPNEDACGMVSFFARQESAAARALLQELRERYPASGCAIADRLTVPLRPRPLPTPPSPSRTAQADLVIQTFHSGGSKGLASSPTEPLIATGGEKGEVRLWNVDGDLLRVWKLDVAVESSTVSRLAFDTTGRYLAAGVAYNAADQGPYAAAVFEVHTGRLVAKHGFASELSAVFAHPDGSAQIASRDGGVHRLDARGVDSWATAEHDVASFSPDGTRLFVNGASAGPAVWDTRTRRRAVEVKLAPHENIAASAWSPSGKSLVLGVWVRASREWILRRIDARSGATSWSVPVPQASALAVSGDEALIAVSAGSVARLYTWEDGRPVGVLRGGAYRHEAFGMPQGSEQVHRVGFTADGRHILVAADTLRLFDGATGAQGREITGPFRNISRLRSSRAGDRLAWSFAMTDRTELWDLGLGRPIDSVEGGRAEFAPDGTWFVAAALSGKLTRANATTGETTWSVQLPVQLSSVTIHPDARSIAAGAWNGQVWILDAQTGAIRHELKPDTCVNALAFSGKGEELIVGGCEVMTVDQGYGLSAWDPATKQSRWRLEASSDWAEGDYDNAVTSLAEGPEPGTIFFGTKAGRIGLVRIADGQSLGSWAARHRSVEHFERDPSGRIRVGLYEGRFKLEALDGKSAALTFEEVPGSFAARPGSTELFVARRDGTVELRRGDELLAWLWSNHQEWAVVDAKRRFDGANAGEVAGLHWVIGTEAVQLNQLKQRFYDPSLLAKHLGEVEEPLRPVESLGAVRLYPAVEAELTAKGTARVRLRDRGGGIGRVQVLLNGKELTEDARGPGFRRGQRQATLEVKVPDSFLLPNGRNELRVIAWNEEGYLSSRGVELEAEEDDQEITPPRFYAIVAGISDYANEGLSLRYAARDAESMAQALKLGAERQFGADRVEIIALTSTARDEALLPTKANLRRAFEKLSTAKPGDFVVVHLAGHGIALPGGDGEYCYLTRDARSLDARALADPAVRELSCVTSEELVGWIKQSPATRQVMILDTCAAGAAASRLFERREIPSDQIRAIDRLKDRTGFHVLMGSAADAVSYEANQFAQGLLTYSILQGMKGAALREGQFVDVSQLFQFAADRVPQLARQIGGIQRPIIAAPQGTSFDIGRLADEDKRRIPLAEPRPLVVRPVIMGLDGVDRLNLMAGLRRQLRGAASESPHTPYVYVDVTSDELPGAVAPSGTYRVENGRVKIRLLLTRDGAELQTIDLDTEPAVAARELSARVQTALEKIRPVSAK